MANSKYSAGSRGTSTKTRKRNLEDVKVFVHELVDLKKDIKRGEPLNRALHLFWSIFCLCFGQVLAAALTTPNFKWVEYIMGLSATAQAIMVVSLLASVLLVFLARSQNRPMETIDQILEQCGYDESQENKKGKP